MSVPTYTVVYCDRPPHEKGLPQPLLAIENPRPLQKSDADMIREMLDEEKESVNRYYFLISWDYFLQKYSA